jgi:hypothetical protein
MTGLIANYKNVRNSATVIPDCAMIPRSVPRLRSPLWTGTVTLRTGSVARMSRQWLPDVRDTAKPARSSARMTSRAVSAGYRSFMPQA